jgi:hypothetical protein
MDWLRSGGENPAEIDCHGGDMWGGGDTGMIRDGAAESHNKEARK